MERLLHYSPDPAPQLSYTLRMQYRMHQSIVQWPSEALYNNALLSHHSVKEHLLRWVGGLRQEVLSSLATDVLVKT